MNYLEIKDNKTIIERNKLYKKCSFPFSEEFKNKSEIEEIFNTFTLEEFISRFCIRCLAYKDVCDLKKM